MHFVWPENLFLPCHFFLPFKTFHIAKAFIFVLSYKKHKLFIHTFTNKLRQAAMHLA